MEKWTMKICKDNRINNILKNIWDFIVIGIIGLNTFILLISKASIDEELKIVVVCFTFFYVLFLLLTLFVKKQKRPIVVKKLRRFFKIIYVLLYLVVIHLQLIKVIQDNYITNKPQHILYYIIMIIGVLLIIPSKITIEKLWKKIIKK